MNLRKYVVFQEREKEVLADLEIRQNIAEELKKERERLKRSKISRRFFFDGTDCGDKVCSLEFHVLPNCIIHLPTNISTCTIPCVMSGCKTELHHFISCPVWICSPITTTSTTQSTTSTSSSSTTTTKSTTSSTSSSTKTTSTLSTTTSSPYTSSSTTTSFPSTSTPTSSSTTSSSSPPISTTTTSLATTTSTVQPPHYSETGLYLSLSFNFVFLILIGLFLQKKCKRILIRRQRERDLLRHAQTERNQLGPPIIRRRTDNDHLFSLDSYSDNSSHGSQNGNQNEPSETQPLLTRMFATPTMGLISSPLNIPRPSSAVSEAQSARSTSGWSWSDVSVTPPIFTIKRHIKLNGKMQPISLT